MNQAIERVRQEDAFSRHSGHVAVVKGNLLMGKEKKNVHSFHLHSYPKKSVQLRPKGIETKDSVTKDVREKRKKVVFLLFCSSDFRRFNFFFSPE